MTCPAPAGQSCNGAATLSSTERLGGKRVVGLSARSPLTKRVTVGETAFAVGAGQTKMVLVLLNGTGRGLLARFHSLPVRVTVTLTNGAGGGPSIVANPKLLIVALDTPRVARAIERDILSQVHIHAKVTCPAVVIQKKGNNFMCTATTTTGKGKHKTRAKTPFKVTQLNDNGDVTYLGE